MRRIPVYALAVVTALGGYLASPAQADVIFGYSGFTRTDGGIVAGNSFTTSGAQTISALGFIDVGSDGILGTYQLGLWDSAMSLIGTTTVGPSSPLVNGFRYGAITPVVIPSGQTFTMAALLPATPLDAWLDNATLALGPGYGGAGTGQFVTSGTLVFPTGTDSSNYAIVNAGDIEIVPEPAALGLLGLGSLGLLARRKRLA